VKESFDQITQDLVLSEKSLLANIAKLEEELAFVKKREEEIIYKFSHDLQQPVTTLIGYLDLFKRSYGGQVDERGRTYLENIYLSTTRMADMLKELSNYSRAGIKGEEMEVDMRELVLEVWDSLKELRSGKNATLDLAPLPVLKVNGSDMQLLFFHLLKNSLLYQGGGASAKITLRAFPEVKGWRFELQDNGIGIPEGSAEEVFDLFFRLHGSSEYPGGGIGLAICKRIIAAYDGSIAVIPGQKLGTLIAFTLPLEEVS